jgi:membrane peptidoglycan carboxypeptidase
VHLPTLRLDRLDFAADTPYETRLAYHPPAGLRVLAPEVAQVARAALARVVEGGSAQRLRGVFTRADGTPIPVGGKTGTGDHRFETYGKGGALVSSRVVSRSGTFVFYIGERHFGVLTAYVKGPDAADYKFTSALPAQILKVLAPKLLDSVGREASGGTTCASGAPARPKA